jgi:peptidoglycan hydrolase-like protein with peptidoglycan-binding domain
MIIPFKHAIKAGTRGKDVLAVKRALSKAGYMQWGGFTPLFGPFAVRATKNFQKAKGLPVNGHIDGATLKKLAPYFDAYGFLLYTGFPPGSTVRNRILAYAIWGYNNRGQMHYSQERPMDLMNDLYHLPVWNDCSEFATKAYKFAGAKDPNGNGYNGYGFTGTLAQHGRVVDLVHAQIGDLVLYGHAPSFSHVAIYIGKGRVISHGSEGGPFLLPIDYRRDRAQIRSYL